MTPYSVFDLIVGSITMDEDLPDGVHIDNRIESLLIHAWIAIYHKDIHKGARLITKAWDEFSESLKVKQSKNDCMVLKGLINRIGAITNAVKDPFKQLMLFLLVDGQKIGLEFDSLDTRASSSIKDLCGIHGPIVKYICIGDYETPRKLVIDPILDLVSIPMIQKYEVLVMHLLDTFYLALKDLYMHLDVDQQNNFLNVSNEPILYRVFDFLLDEPNVSIILQENERNNSIVSQTLDSAWRKIKEDSDFYSAKCLLNECWVLVDIMKSYRESRVLKQKIVSTAVEMYKWCICTRDKLEFLYYSLGWGDSITRPILNSHGIIEKVNIDLCIATEYLKANQPELARDILRDVMDILEELRDYGVPPDYSSCVEKVESLFSSSDLFVEDSQSNY